MENIISALPRQSSCNSAKLRFTACQHHKGSVTLSANCTSSSRAPASASSRCASSYNGYSTRKTPRTHTCTVTCFAAARTAFAAAVRRAPARQCPTAYRRNSARRHNDAKSTRPAWRMASSGQAGGLGRLPVVGITHARAVPQNVCVNIVVGRTVLARIPFKKASAFSSVSAKAAWAINSDFFLLDARLRRAPVSSYMLPSSAPPAARRSTCASRRFFSVTHLTSGCAASSAFTCVPSRFGKSHTQRRKLRSNRSGHPAPISGAHAAVRCPYAPQHARQAHGPGIVQINRGLRAGEPQFQRAPKFPSMIHASFAISFSTVGRHAARSMATQPGCQYKPSRCTTGRPVAAPNAPACFARAAAAQDQGFVSLRPIPFLFLPNSNKTKGGSLETALCRGTYYSPRLKRFFKAVHASAGINQLLLAGVERMALVAKPRRGSPSSWSGS